MARFVALSEALYGYLIEVSSREPEILARLRAETAPLAGAGMQISTDQAQFMQLLVRLIGARRCLEIGVYTGYSSLAVALVLPPGGTIVACDVNAEWTAIAQRYWRAAGVADRIDLRLAPALATLDGLLAKGAAGTFDFAFIDADKENNENYFDRVLQLLRPGGLIAVDNTLWNGSVIDGAKTDGDTEAIRAFNRRRRDDERVAISLVPVGDGLTLAMKRG